MESVIRRWPEQFRAGLRAAASVPADLSREASAKWEALAKAGPFSSVLVAGMGASWMPGGLVQEAGLSTVPISIHRGYGLSDGLSVNTLVVVSSFSGNTEETLSAYDAAKAARLPLVGIAAGGELERWCATDGVPFVSIPADPPTMQPRSATGYTVGILVQLLSRLGLAAPNAVDTVEGLEERLGTFMDTARARGEKIADAITGATPVVYASDRFPTVARVWKIKFNENAKTPAFWNVFPELNHNEMIGWTQSGRPAPRSLGEVGSLGEGRSNPHGAFHLVLLRDADDHPRVLKRFEITLALLRETGLPASIVPIEGSTMTEKIFSTLLVGDWASYTLALALGTDPSPVPMVEDLKRRLKE